MISPYCHNVLKWNFSEQAFLDKQVVIDKGVETCTSSNEFSHKFYKGIRLLYAIIKLVVSTDIIHIDADFIGMYFLGTQSQVIIFHGINWSLTE